MTTAMASLDNMAISTPWDGDRAPKDDNDKFWESTRVPTIPKFKKPIPNEL
jgi:hypothetical protein